MTNGMNVPMGNNIMGNQTGFPNPQIGGNPMSANMNRPPPNQNIMDPNNMPNSLPNLGGNDPISMVCSIYLNILNGF